MSDQVNAESNPTPATMTDSPNHTSETALVKEDDTPKLFFGQIPRSMTEEELSELCAEFGPVFELAILKDKFSGESRGCAFVTYYTKADAENAMTQLHGQRTLPGMTHTLQVKIADGEKSKDMNRKIFVGMIGKATSEDDLRGIFGPYGVVEDITVLRHPDGNGRGCGFVRFATREQAQAAINALHNSMTLDGCTAPMVVKFADTDKDKVTKKMQTMGQLGGMQYGMMNPYGMQQMGMGGMGMGGMGMGAMGMGGMGGMGAMGMGTMGMMNQQMMGGMQQPGMGGMATAPGMGGMATMGSMDGSMMGSAAMTGNAMGTAANMGQGMGMIGGTGAAAVSGGYTQPGMISGQMQGYGVQQQAGMQQYGMYGGAMASTQTAATKVDAQGPDGANLFIYHLPNEWSDNDLYSNFVIFGNVVSAKVFIDRNTGLSKCFGFVSYDNVPSATSAIQSMNGYQVGSKRLKVQLKTARAAAKPY